MNKKILFFIISIIILGTILTFLSAFIIPQGERVSSGYRLPGFPFGFGESYGGGGVPGAFSIRFLIIPFIIDLLFWVIISAVILLLTKRIKKRT